MSLDLLQLLEHEAVFQVRGAVLQTRLGRHLLRHLQQPPAVSERGEPGGVGGSLLVARTSLTLAGAVIEGPADHPAVEPGVGEVEYQYLLSRAHPLYSNMRVRGYARTSTKPAAVKSVSKASA